MTHAEQSAMFALCRAERAPRRKAEMIRARAAVTLPAVVAVPGGFAKPATPAGYVDITCHDFDEVHRVEIGDSEIPFVICPHSGAREMALLEAWSADAREGYSVFQRLLADLYTGDPGSTDVSTFTVDLARRPASLSALYCWHQLYGWPEMR